eukprot:XP_014034389.1 PREDICTED: RNA-directed DNA polymerase homolog [Salmo salar]
MHTSLQGSSALLPPTTSAGFFFVEKKDKTLHPCIDYRGLNEIMVKNCYPLPLISSTFEPLQGAIVFSKLDLRNAYQMVRIREGDKWKTAFNTASGHYEYLFMPFGLSNSPALFQALINDVLRNMLNRFVFIYLDDILVFSNINPRIRALRPTRSPTPPGEPAFYVSHYRAAYDVVLLVMWNGPVSQAASRSDESGSSEDLNPR